MRLAGGLWVARRWVFFGMMTNSPDPGVEAKFVPAARSIFGLVVDGLGG